LVIAAPSQYWAAVLSTSSGPVEGKTPFEARPILRDILERASKDGFPITLVSLKGEGAGKSLRVVGAEAISLQSRLVPTGK